MSGTSLAESAVLLLGFGGPDCLDAVEPFMCNLMETPPSESLVDSVKTRYEAIGGRSPLMKVASSIAKGLEAELEGSGTPATVSPAMRYWHPFIDDTLRGLHGRGVRRVVTVSLSPFESAVSTGAYREAIAEAATDLPGLEIVEAPPLRELEPFVALLAEAARAASARLTHDQPLLTIFTAHSLPMDDPAATEEYVSQLRATVDIIAEDLGMPVAGMLDGASPVLRGVSGYGSLLEPRPWVLAYQSRGRRGGEWLGPDIDELVDAAVEGGFKGLAICPVGFATDHMETLYDLDIVLAARIDAVGGVRLARAPVPNDHPLLVRGIAESVRPLL